MTRSYQQAKTKGLKALRLQLPDGQFQEAIRVAAAEKNLSVAAYCAQSIAAALLQPALQEPPTAVRPGPWHIRCDLPAQVHQDLRFYAARQGKPMSRVARSLVLWNVQQSGGESELVKKIKKVDWIKLILAKKQADPHFADDNPLDDYGCFDESMPVGNSTLAHYFHRAEAGRDKPQPDDETIQTWLGKNKISLGDLDKFLFDSDLVKKIKKVDWNKLIAAKEKDDPNFAKDNQLADHGYLIKSMAATNGSLAYYFCRADADQDKPQPDDETIKKWLGKNKISIDDLDEYLLDSDLVKKIKAADWLHLLEYKLEHDSDFAENFLGERYLQQLWERGQTTNDQWVTFFLMAGRSIQPDDKAILDWLTKHHITIADFGS